MKTNGAWQTLPTTGTLPGMAQPTPSKAPPKPDPEVRAFALVHRGPAMWSMREYLIQGDRVIAFTDAEPDARAPTTGRIVRRLEKVVP